MADLSGRPTPSCSKVLQQAVFPDTKRDVSDIMKSRLVRGKLSAYILGPAAEFFFAVCEW
jgi:hypothetical protein